MSLALQKRPGKHWRQGDLSNGYPDGYLLWHVQKSAQRMTEKDGNHRTSREPVTCGMPDRELF